ncbi:MscS Mechanosensitive ion channel [Alkaliphilus metalliredigens QYMF]|uniref:MscS Mechanosensitive ion channel n=1 Tax=Alkaliphilus metalliredigens (strain QYMF) TaxID=293826 RepID=A6TJA4_ALKMQ|nr:mechanosensitive ion channel family protein [Alkaliphilus metalliredigens]ABR46272.1 MscS Mechanosensitive ion channel [Alkaliphilus metalliredigens QYMF]
MEELMTSLEIILDNMREFITNPEQLSTIIANSVKIVVILVVAKVSIRILYSITNQIFQQQKSLKLNTDLPRMETLNGLIKSLIKYGIYFIAITTIISFFGVKVTGLIATAGIGGLAIGFGAQNLVRDVITGFFILFENQFSIGHYIEVNGVSGIVEEMAMRITKVRDFNGDLHIIPNGQIQKLTNKSTGKMRAWVDISIAYEEDIDRAIEVLTTKSEQLRMENANIVEGPTVLGVTGLGNSDVVISIMAKTVPMEQWAIERLMRKTFKQAFDEVGIEIPYPRRVIISQNEKSEM